MRGRNPFRICYSTHRQVTDTRTYTDRAQTLPPLPISYLTTRYLVRAGPISRPQSPINLAAISASSLNLSTSISPQPRPQYRPRARPPDLYCTPSLLDRYSISLTAPSSSDAWRESARAPSSPASLQPPSSEPPPAWLKRSSSRSRPSELTE